MSTLLVARPARAPHPMELMAYLRHAGWTLRHRDERWTVYARGDLGQPVEIEVPQLALASDYARCVEMLLKDLELVERRPAFDILRDIEATGRDLARFRLLGPELADGRIPIEAGARVHQALRDIVLASACSALDPKPVLAKRKPAQAMRHLDHVHFAAATMGSYVISIETPVPPRLLSDADLDDDPEPPFERVVGLTLARALSAARSAVEEASATQSLDPFTSRVGQGLSANLCEALSALFDLSTIHSVAVDFSFATTRPAPREVPRAVQLSAEAHPILREVASELRARAPVWDFEVQGPIIRLESPDPSRGGHAIVLTDVEGRHRSVRMMLLPADYQAAVKAHTERSIVRCVGELVREGRSLALQNARAFEVIRTEEP